jgi:hypothetical protein
MIKEYVNCHQEKTLAVRYSYPAPPSVRQWIGLAYIQEQKYRHIGAIGLIIFRCSENRTATVEEGCYIFRKDDGYLGFASAKEFENSFKENSEQNK